MSMLVESLLIDWEVLWVVVLDVMVKVYVLYLNFFVGVVVFVDDGCVIFGCNVENVLYGIGFCVECVFVLSLYMMGGGKFVVFVCVDGNGGVFMLCGWCWQLFYEYLVQGMLLVIVFGICIIDEVLFDVFGLCIFVEYLV